MGKTLLCTQSLLSDRRRQGCEGSSTKYPCVFIWFLDMALDRYGDDFKGRSVFAIQHIIIIMVMSNVGIS